MTRRDAKPYTETWLSVARIGPRDPALVGAELFNAHTAYVAARAAVNAGNGLQQMYNDAADALGELLKLVSTDKALDPFLADYLHEWCPAYTPDSADAFLDQWEQQRGRRRSRPAAPTNAPVSSPAPARIVERATPREVAPASDDERIAALFREGLGQRAIARETGIPKTTVRRCLIEMRLLDA